MRRRHRRIDAEAELDITTFMNLMIVLVPVLLLNMVFAQNSVLQLNFPQGPASSVPLDPTQFQLQVIVRDGYVVVAESRGGLIARIDNLPEGPDLAKLQETLKAVKSRVPDKKDVSVLLEPKINYQTLVSLMDTVRSFDAVVAMSVVEAELFPDISLGDAPSAAALAPSLPATGVTP